jgi:hypothetical protein
MNNSFCYPSSTNIGDDIQTLAAIGLLGECNLIDRDKLRVFGGSGKLILNGWWTHDPINAWPPPPQLDCLPISIHVTEKAKQRFSNYKAWFKGKKVLARDESTNIFFKSLGIDSEFGGCLTLTFPRRQPKERKGIYLVDVPGIIYPDGERITHNISPTLKNDSQYRQKVAKELLSKYQNAELVITSRLHCALPCAAFGTPVVVVNNGPRYTGMERFFTIYNGNLDESIGKALSFDDSEVKKYARKLRKVVKEWSI